MMMMIGLPNSFFLPPLKKYEQIKSIMSTCYGALYANASEKWERETMMK